MKMNQVKNQHLLCPAFVLSHVGLFATLWTIVRQAVLSMGFSRQKYGSELPFPTPGDLPNPGIKPMSLASPSLAGGFFTTLPPGKPSVQRHSSKYYIHINLLSLLTTLWGCETLSSLELCRDYAVAGSGPRQSGPRTLAPNQDVITLHACSVVPVVSDSS